MIAALLSLTGVGGIAAIALRLFGLSGTIAKVTSFGQGAKAAAKKVPRWVWIVLATAAVLLGGYLWVNHKIHQAYANGSKAGHAAQFAHDQAENDKIRQQAIAWKRKADQANATIHQKEQALHDQTVASNRALADALRLRLGAAHQPSGGSGQHLSGASAAAVQPGGPQSQADAAVASGAAAPRVCVDAGALIDYAEQADNDHDALIHTEDAWKGYKGNEPKPPGR